MGTKKGNKAYKKGYYLERWISLYLSYHNWHVKRNYGSKGVEDLIAVKKGEPVLFIQCKNTKKLNMSRQEIEVLRQHANEYGAVGIIIYKTEKGHKMFYNVNNNTFDILKVVPEGNMKDWVKKVNEIKKERKIKSCNCVVEKMKSFIHRIGL